jgi:hypothetical protein
MKKLIFLFFCIFTSNLSRAEGFVTIRGKLSSNTSQKIALETKKRVYTMNKSMISPEQLSAIKSGKLVALMVPFSAIEKVEEK